MVTTSPILIGRQADIIHCSSYRHLPACFPGANTTVMSIHLNRLPPHEIVHWIGIIRHHDLCKMVVDSETFLLAGHSYCMQRYRICTADTIQNSLMAMTALQLKRSGPNCSQPDTTKGDASHVRGTWQPHECHRREILSAMR